MSKSASKFRLILTQIKEINTEVTASSNDNVSNELSVIKDSLTVIIKDSLKGTSRHFAMKSSRF